MASSPHKVPGGFVVLFEGIDGVGKTTQLKLAEASLSEDKRAVHITRNLGGTPIGEALRSVTLSDTPRSPETDLYISVAIQVALAESIKSHAQQGDIVLVDRGPLSLAAYHIYGSKVDPELGWRYADEGMKQFKPDLVIIYSADLETALRRAKRRAGKSDYFASKPREYFENVVKGFQAAQKRYQAYDIEIIDATKDIEAIHAETMRLIDASLKGKTGKHKH